LLAASEQRPSAAQPAVPADRFAREIVRFLTVCAARSRQLNANPFGGNYHHLPHTAQQNLNFARLYLI
jgi:hypothetical protein